MSNIELKKEIYVINTINSIDKKCWKEFVSNHPNGNIFQSPEFYDACNNTRLSEPLILIHRNDTEILGLLLANIQRQYSNVLGRYTARSIVIGGPLIKNNNSDILNNILNSYNQMIRKRAIYSEFRNIFNLKEKDEIFIYNGYKVEPHLNITVDLTKTETELWKEVNNKAKNRIRAAKKRGTKFIVEDTFSALEKCYDILREVYSRIRLPIAKFDYFQNLYNAFKEDKNKFIIFTSQYSNIIIGLLFAIGYKDTLYGLYNGAKMEYYDKGPNDLLPWEIFMWAKNTGYKKFDWLGAGKPGIPYGVRDYKMKFGGELVNLGRYQMINRPYIYKIGEIGIKLFRYMN